MPTPRCFFVALLLCATPALAQTVPTPAPLPDANIEARAARELNALSPAILSRHPRQASDGARMQLAFAFARLGRIEAGIQAANAMVVQHGDASGNGGLVRDEVRHLGARRRAILGNVTGARALSNSITTPRLRADALLSIARAQMRVGDVVGARKTLFQALPLVGQDRRAQTYIAVLLYRAGEHDTSKRLLSQVEKALPPVKPATTTAPQPLNAAQGNDDWRSLAWALLQTGQVEKGAQLLSVIEGYNAPPTLHSLVHIGAGDLAVRLARENPDAQSQLYGLLAVAWALARVSPERAAPLLGDIGQRLQNLPPDKARSQGDFLSRRQQDALVLAELQRRAGDDASATTRLDALLAQVGPTSAAHARLSFALSPFLFDDAQAGEAPRPTRLTRPQIEQISQEVNAALPQGNVFDFIGVLPEFVDAQIEVGALESARQTLTLLETKVLSDHDARRGPDGGPINTLSSALAIAQRWQKLGDSKRTNAWLNRVWNSSLAKSLTPRDRAWLFIAFGFVDEGKRRLAMVGPLSQEAVYLSPSLPYFEAKFKPKAFPVWIQNLHTPQTKLTALADFSLGLTQSLFQSPQEREFSLSAGGLGYSGYSITY